MLAVLLLDGCGVDYSPRGPGSGPPVQPHPPEDRDGDGFSYLDDCDDLDAGVNPRHVEDCDGRDNNCDGLVDELPAGELACHREDSFDQEMTADVLVVLDNSTRMRDAGYWDLAADGAYDMARHLVGDHAETHLGLLVDDMVNPAYSGRLFAPNQFAEDWLAGDDVFLTDAQLRVFYGGLADRDDPSDAEPKGLRLATTTALDLAEKGTANNGFFRGAGALFALVLLTDADDATAPLNADFVTDVSGYAGGLDNVRIYTVTQTSDRACDGSPSAEALSIEALVDQTGGMVETVCREDWGGFLSGVGQDIASQALHSRFPLSAVPELDGSLQVTIDPDPTTDGDEYVWQGTTTIEPPATLVFVDGKPPAGSTITVDYLKDWTYGGG